MKTRALIIAVLLVCRLGQADEPALGRLFTTPAERAALDQQRRLGGIVAGPDAAAEPEPSTATLYGYVVRQNGSAVAWLDPESTQQTTRHLVITQMPHRAPVVSVHAANGRRVTVKVGDSVDLQTGQVQQLVLKGIGAGTTDPRTDHRPAAPSR